MRLFSLFAAGLLGISLSVASGAAAGPSLDPAEFALAAPGTIVDGRQGDGTDTKLRVDGIGDFTYTTTDLAGDGGQRTRHVWCWGCDPKTYPIELERYRDLWPIEVGKSVKFQRRRASDGEVWIHKIKIVSTETVKTEFGPIDTFVVEQTVRGSGTNGWRATTKTWFAPSIEWAVKAEWWSTSGGKGTWEITSITPPG